MMREHMVDERVAAHERLGGVGVRADHRDARVRVGPERQGPVVREQDDRLAGQPTRDVAMGGGVEVDLGGGLIEGLVEQAELLLLGEHAQHGAVDQRLVDPAVAHGGRERGGEGVACRQLDIDAGHQRESGRLAEIRGDAVHRVQERHREVVGDYDAVEAPALAQDAGQELLGGRHRHAVDRGVRVHDRARAAVADGHLEGREQHVGELPLAQLHRGVIAPGL